MSLLALVFIFLVLVFFSVTLSILTERQTALFQTILLLETRAGGREGRGGECRESARPE